jgi:hypothetical protein
VEYCTNCGASRQEGANFCGSCGRPFGAEAEPEPQPATATAAPTSAADTPYGGEMTIVAVLLTVAVPFIALIAALVIRANELRPSRRGFLKSWAIGSAAWLCTGWIVVFLVFTSITSSAGGCKGGIDQFSPPSFQSSDNVHWTATYACVGGGTKTVAYHGKVP